MDKNYRLGLDIGVASVGWSILENDPLTEDPIRIIKLGVRKFNANEVPKTGESTAKDRRIKRGIRRRKRRKALRIKTAKELLEKQIQIDVEKSLQEIANSDVYFLRAQAIENRITDAELCRVILNIFKRRGFKSNRKNVLDEESGKLLSHINKNEEFLRVKGYRTLGEAFYKDEKFFSEIVGKDGKVKRIYNIRNHDGAYTNCVSRALLCDEIRLILETQNRLGNDKITKEFIETVIILFEKQRNFDEGPGEPSPYSATFEIGNCTFIKGEKRAPKSTFTFEYFTALSKINSLRIDDEELSKVQKQALYKLLLTKKEIKFKDVRKLFNIPIDVRFNLCRYLQNKKDETLTEEELLVKSENTAFVKMTNSYDVRTKLDLEINENSVNIIDEVGTILTLYKSDDKIDEQIENSLLLKNLAQQQKEKIKAFNFSKVGSLSIKAMRSIIPYLLEGERYDEACKKAGYNHSSFSFDKNKYIKSEAVAERISDITSPVVKRAVNQTIRVINEVVKKYGSPQFVTIELARDISKNSNDRRNIEKQQKENFIKNEEVKEILVKEHNIVRPTSVDVLKYKLYIEQECKCMYSGEAIDVNRLFEDGYVEIDHILPYSRSMNDSYNNKALVFVKENQNKKNRTPYEYFGNDEARWNNFVARTNLLNNTEKKRFLLKKNFGEAQKKEFISRNLNDTRYVSRFIHGIIKDFLAMKPSTKYKNVVRSVNGAVTSYLRKFWGVNKIREDGDAHHAIDATIIATATDGMVQKVVKYNDMRERFVYRKDGVYINKTTGEIMDKEEMLAYQQEGINVYSKYMPKPYDNFVEELKIRSSINYETNKFNDEDTQALIRIGYSEEDIASAKPLFVSRMKNVKATGPIHQETLKSIREYSETSRLIVSVTLDKLKLVNKVEEVPLKDDEYPNCSIENYYRPTDDRLLYLKLKKHLVEKGGYKKGEYETKPKKDGTDGPIVKKVKLYEFTTNCVITPNGAASNDKMYRVDVFKKNGKFYLCPIYMADVYAKKLPNKVIEIGKEWSEINNSFEFLFSLYQNDLIKVTSKKYVKLSKVNKNEKSTRENEILQSRIVGYYKGTDTANASIKIDTHDSCYFIRGLGVKNLLNI